MIKLFWMKNSDIELQINPSKLYSRLAIEILFDTFLVTVFFFSFGQEQHLLSSTHQENNPSQSIF